MLPIVRPELAERSEEMIVCRLAPRNEVTHREAVDHRARQRIVGLRARGLDAVFPAIARKRGDYGVRSQIQTQPILRGDAKVRFGVDGAARMKMQIAALGHPEKKGV